MRLKLSRYAPPGMELKTEITFFATGMSASFVYSLFFLWRFMNARSRLYGWKIGGGQQVVRALLEGAVMPDFAELLGSALYGFGILCACMLFFAAYHYLYHYQESKSVYLMRRLPDSREWHRRCLTLPVVAILISILTAFFLLMLYYGIYMAATPKECLEPGQWQRLWQYYK